MAGRRFYTPTQLNSATKLYSTENISNAINKQSEQLSNGAVGKSTMKTIQRVQREIDFHRMLKPGHLANSEVLKMLEEEEINRFQQRGFKRVAWPPPAAEREQSGLDGGQGSFELVEEPPPLYCEAPAYTHAKAAPPAVTPRQTWENYIGSRPPHPPTPTARSIIPSASPPPPTTITLRATPPIQQEPAPVFESQPAATHDQGGLRMRGDEKWPPAAVKQQAVVENEARIALARGPALRPRKVKRDYSNFFAQHALANNYPSYRAPPGTQHYIEDGTSQL